jgi:hypothetical protein
MKKLLIGFLLLTLVNPASFASSNAQHSLQAKEFWHPITIYNNTNVNMHYYFVVQENLRTTQYKIKANSSDIYHTGITTKGYFQGWSLDLDKGYYHIATNQKFYNLELVNSITIDTQDSITVTCIAGDSESCVIK